MDQPVEAFISWSHQQGSPSETAAWRHSVGAFADLLRSVGIDADIDLYHTEDLDVSWDIYGTTSIQNARFVLIVVSASYLDRWLDRGSPLQGAGAAREAIVLRHNFERDRLAFRSRTKIVLLPGSSEDDIPADLGHLVRFEISTLNQTAVQDLCRHLMQDPARPKPPLGPRIPLGPQVSTVESAESTTHPRSNKLEREREVQEAEQQRSHLLERLRSIPDDGSENIALPWVRQRHLLMGEIGTVDSQLHELYALRSAAGYIRCFRCKSPVDHQEWASGVCPTCGYVNELD